MDAQLLQTLGQIAGVGGLSVGVALLVFRDVIRKNIFPKFKDEHLAYRLLRLIVILSWTIAVLGMGAWFSVNILEARTPDSISIASAEFSGDLEVESLEFIMNQYIEITGGPIADSEVTDRLKRATNLIIGGRYESALSLFEEVAAEVDIPAVYNNLGALYAVNRRFDDAEAAFEKAIERDPENAAVQLNLGMLKERRGDTEAASRHFERAGIFEAARAAERRIASISPPVRSSSQISALRSSSQIPDVSAELIEFSRFERTITVKVRFINSGEQNQELYPAYYQTSYLIDEATDYRLRMTAASNGSVTVPAGGSFEFWTKHTLGEGDMPRNLTVVLNHGILFEHIEVP